MSESAVQTKPFFKGSYPIGGDPMALPVKAVGPAIGYYTRILGFRLVSKTEHTALLQRDDVTIGLAVNTEDPDQTSVYFAVNEVEALHAEIEATGIEPSVLRLDDYGGKKYRVFFAKEPYGVCFCFGMLIEE